MKKETDTSDTQASDGHRPPLQALAIYEVLCESVKIGGVIAYRTARVNLTTEQAAALNTAQPGTVRFLGI